MIPVALVMIALEAIWSKRTARSLYSVCDTMNNFILAVGRILVTPLVQTFPAYLYSVMTPFTIFHIQWSWLTVTACFLINDFCGYIGHRIGHRVRWAWADHVNHHSSRKLNFSTAIRQGWFAYLTPSAISVLPLILLGFRWQMVVFVNGLNLAYQFFLHTTLVTKLPTGIEYIFNTPSHHRVHHASNPRYLDRNFGNVLIIWDRIFGTFHEEDDSEPPIYGITENIDSSIPTTVIFHEWYSLVKDIGKAKNIREIFGYLFAPPGWAPVANASEIPQNLTPTGLSGAVKGEERQEE